jgi:homoserine O-acetyltransferase
VTHGTLNAQKSNAILMVTAISGNHHRLDCLIGPGKALDTTKYFIVATDAIGNGLTTSPSNSPAQARMAFPRFLIRDMVTSQHKLMTEHLKIPHVLAVVGTSMGGMQALQWGVSQPDFMDSLVAWYRWPGRRPGAWWSWRPAARRSCSTRPGMAATTRRRRRHPPVARHPGLPGRAGAEMYRYQFPNQADVLPWLKAQEDAQIRCSTPTTGSTRRGRTTPTTSAPRPA